MTAVSAQEARYDFLEVNGIAFSGEIGPENVVPSGVIKWDAAAEMHIDAGWCKKLRSCRQAEVLCDYMGGKARRRCSKWL